MNFNTQDHYGALMSAHEHSWALLSINEYCAKALWVLNSPWCHDHECLSSLMSAVEAMAQYTWVFKAAYEYSWVLMSAQECPWVLIIAHECSWHHVHACSGLLMSIHEYSWALISSHEHSWAWRIGTMAPTAFISANKWWWAWRHGAITTHSALAQYFSVLKSAHKCPWALLSASEYSCAILRVQGVDSVISIKCWFLKWLHFSILAISRSRFHQIITN